MAELFGFKITRKDEKEIGSFAPKVEDDGAAVVAEGGVYGTYVDLEGSTRTESELVTRYRRMALQPECELAIDDIVNETIIYSQEHKLVEINLDSVNIPTRVKKIVTEEFDQVKELMDFNNKGYDIFRHWYVDGIVLSCNY